MDWYLVASDFLYNYLISLFDIQADDVDAEVSRAF